MFQIKEISNFQTKKLEGNDRFEGFAIDLMTEIAKFLQFNISFKLVDDGAVKTIDFTTYLMFYD